MSIFSSVLEEIDNGKNGLNEGLPHRFKKIIDYIPNIQRGTYYTIGGDLGTGKTSFIDDMFILSPFNLKTTQKMFVMYYSLEISATTKICKFISRKIYDDTGEMFDTNYILSRGKNKINSDIYELVKSYKDYYEQFLDNIIIKDTPINPTGIYTDIIKEFNNRFGTVSTGSNNELLVKFNEGYENIYFMVIIDHIGLLNTEKSYSKKENIDVMSKYLLFLRNKLKIIPIVSNQFNRAISSSDRHKLQLVVPQLSDFSDSASTQQDANIVMALFSPSRYGLKELSIGDNIIDVTNNTRGLFILKNRDGSDNKNILMDFEGKIGYFKEI